MSSLIVYFFSVQIVVLLILFTVLNYMVAWSHIILKINYYLKLNLIYIKKEKKETPNVYKILPYV